MLRISLRPFGGRGAEIVEFVIRIRIPSWLEKLAVLPLLWYRKLRYGYTFRRIPISQGKFAIVDPDDYERISRHKWYACRRNRTYYAIRGQWSPALKKRLTISMHREIIDVPDDLFVDHINHNGWDNRKANLRPATAAENAQNARYPKINTTSKYRGVWYNKKKKRWRAVIGINNTRKVIGSFRNEIDAAIAYDRAAKKYHKEFAVLNFQNENLTTNLPCEITALPISRGEH